MIVLQSIVEEATQLSVRLVGLAVLSGTMAAIGALVFRWYAREAIPRGLALLVGLSGVALYLNTTTALGQAIGGSTETTEVGVALFNIVAFLSGTGGALAGRGVGDRFATDVVLGGTARNVDENVGRLVQTVGRVIVVELPEEIDDVVGYDPVPDTTKEKLAGKKFVFPRKLTVAELRDRLVGRLKSDYAVGNVDIELKDDGSVGYLALGSRAAGIGPTLPPATNAVAIRADPAFAASAGDLVQVWETEPMRRVVTAELRGVAGDIVTIAIDSADTPKLDPTRKYRLVTLPVDNRPEREFASLLRAADETFSTVTVAAGSPLHGLPAGGLDLTIVAIKPEAGEPTILPGPEYILQPGNVICAIALPETLRRLETAARPLDPSLVRSIDSGDGSATVSEPTAPSESQSDAAGAKPAATANGDEPASTTEEPVATTESPATPDDTGSTEESEEPTESPVTGQADASSFQEIKEEFETTEQDESDGQSETTADEVAFESDEAEDEQSGGVSSFQDLKDEFESGEADWEDESEAGDNADAESIDETSDTSTADDSQTETGDDLIDLESDAGLEEIEFDDGETDDTSPEDDGLDFGDETDDLSDLEFDDTETETLSFDEDDSANSSDDDSADEESDDSGGGTSFAQLKEEFESGDADWEDDVSDSPGGDMRLDE
jgi:hypothetical protein